MVTKKRIKGFKDKIESKLWRHKYKPKTLDDYLCTNSFKQQIERWIDGTNDSHLLFESSLPGTGKSTLAMIIANATSDRVKRINAGKDKSVDIIRDDIYNFISSRSPGKKRKVIILDEFERMSIAAIKAATDMIDDNTSVARFIATCNNFAAIPDLDTRNAFKDRFEHVDFMRIHEGDSSERKTLAANTLKLCEHILKDNNVEYDRKAVIQIIKDNVCGPTVRFRNIINTLYKFNGRELTLDALNAADLELIDVLQSANSMDFKDVRKFIAENAGNSRGIVKELYNNIGEYFDYSKDNFGDVFLVLNECRKDLNDPEDPEIPLAAMFFELSNMGVIK